LINPNIRNLIFDLGGVILNLSVQTTLQQLAKLTGLPVEKIVESYTSRQEFLQYETGQIGDPEFRTALRKIYSIDGTDSMIDSCWNAMLLDIPSERIELLKSLKNRYRTFLLSNTNAIHVRCFSEYLQASHGINSLDALFEKVYYSHTLGMRKPDPHIYEHLLKENDLVASETLFLDDSHKNIEGAQSVGIQTVWVRNPEELYSLFA
jgi:putative hydrolase of the HAD superfamily